MKETKKKNTPKKQASKQSFFKGVKSELKKVKILIFQLIDFQHLTIYRI